MPKAMLHDGIFKYRCGLIPLGRSPEVAFQAIRFQYYSIISGFRQHPTPMAVAGFVRCRPLVLQFGRARATRSSIYLTLTSICHFDSLSLTLSLSSAFLFPFPFLFTLPLPLIFALPLNTRAWRPSDLSLNSGNRSASSSSRMISAFKTTPLYPPPFGLHLPSQSAR